MLTVREVVKPCEGTCSHKYMTEVERNVLSSSSRHSPVAAVTFVTSGASRGGGRTMASVPRSGAPEFVPRRNQQPPPHFSPRCLAPRLTLNERFSLLKQGYPPPESGLVLPNDGFGRRLVRLIDLNGLVCGGSGDRRGGVVGGGRLNIRYADAAGKQQTIGKDGEPGEVSKKESTPSVVINVHSSEDSDSFE